ncbi:isocitrate dehydrogenase [Candidatus Roizmanbacteria bacterium CG22_combo_CG10-13_8_21_14_all_34_12]|uniref:Isocitrate/homoisocitrate dehydrogenase n=1 Tax=Candidatus Roizmanbacteria bacterium CG22_combo_CG10-13_8_21_14_all_34_12 TaxID=1974860 RepID=A0A2H0C094_9BACT|nr:MAG: isocitrate dehydrogenase [Candidatus Roizmanbacteria bacterium CG22_combo_CG10-13_8_21_14_all_34_12]
MKKKYQICYMGGDGIGPDVTIESIRLLQATGISFNFVQAEIGFEAYNKYGTPLPQKTIEICKKSDAILFGAITTPPNIKGYFSPIVHLRKNLDLYANVRPFKSLPIPNQKPGIDFIIVRENTEDLYAGQERLTKEGAIAERVITKKGCEKIIKFAFELAKKQNRKKVTVVHKANILRITDGLFLDIAKKISQRYPQIIMEEMLVDSCAMQLIKKTEAFDVIVTTNMFGDILSDEAAGLTGGLGVAASGNMGNNQGLFEPVHGSAPKYAGRNIANPMASFLSSAMMLEFLGEDKMAQKIRISIKKTIELGLTTKDLGGKLKSSEFTDKVINNL